MSSMCSPTRAMSAGVVVLSLATSAASAVAPTIVGITTDLPGGPFNISFNALSADGSTVVGTATNTTLFTTEAFRWTAATGMVGLGDLPGGPFQSEAFAVSDNGSVVVGEGNPGGIIEAFRWTQATGLVTIGMLPGGTFSRPLGVSGDGSVVVGESASTLTSPFNEAFRWTQATGMVGLGTLSNLSGSSSVANAISSDGSVIVGSSTIDFSTEAFFWTATGGMVGMGDLPTGSVGSVARDTSTDGSVIVGFGNSAPGDEAFRWTQATGMVPLGDFPGGLAISRATGVSGDGSLVFGFGSVLFFGQGFVWTQASGLRTLTDMLAMDFGFVNLGGWVLGGVIDISADGRTILGFGTNPAGIGQAFILTLPLVVPAGPCPGDADGNGTVDFADITSVVANWLSVCP